MLTQTALLIDRKQEARLGSLDGFFGLAWVFKAVNKEDFVLRHVRIANGKAAAADGHRIHIYEPAIPFTNDLAGYWQPVSIRATRMLLLRNHNPEALKYPDLDEYIAKWSLAKADSITVHRGDEGEYAALLRAINRRASIRFNYYTDMVDGQYGDIWYFTKHPDHPIIYRSNHGRFALVMPMKG